MAVESSEIQRGEYLPRVADGLLTQALQSSGAVQIKGPKWCGKTATTAFLPLQSCHTILDL